jgi:hypothetical protein
VPEQDTPRQEKWNLQFIWFAGSIAIMLGLVFSLYRSAYFSTDDFNNLYWVQRTPGGQLLGHIVNPASQFFRPVGMSLYWLLWKCFDLDPLPFHVAAWFFHCLNVVLVYYVIQQTVHFPFAAAVGAALFAFQAAFTDIYWSFGTIFEILATLLFLLAIVAHLRFRSSAWRLPLVIVCFFLGMKSKEMVITLPGVLLLLDLLCPGQPEWKRTRPAITSAIRNFAALLLPVAWFLALNENGIRTAAPTDPYYFDFSLRTLIDGYKWYLNTLFHIQLQPALYAGMFAIFLFYCVRQKDRTALFFFLWVLIALVPVIFLVNHRFDFYWYLPMVGIAGVAAAVITQLADWICVKSRPIPVAIGCVLFAIFCTAHYVIQRINSERARESVLSVSREHRSFMRALGSLKESNRRKTIFFTSVPVRLAPSEVVRSATQIALHRTDVDAFFVTNRNADSDRGSDTTTSGDMIALRYDNGRLIDQTASFQADPEAFLGCMASGRYSLHVSQNDVTAGRDAYSVLVPGLRSVSMSILYSLDNQLKVFNLNLDSNGQATFDVGPSTVKGVYRFLAFNVTGSSEWIHSDATITVH